MGRTDVLPTNVELDRSSYRTAVNTYCAAVCSVYFCAVPSVGVGLYWVMSGVVRMVQQLVINKYLSKMDI